MENISTTCEILLQVSQNHSPNRVCPLSFKVSRCSSVTRIQNLRRLFIAKEKFHRVLMRRDFFNRRQIFPPIRGTSHLRSDCISVNTFLIQIYSYLPILMLYRLDNHFFQAQGKYLYLYANTKYLFWEGRGNFVGIIRVV